MTPLNLVFNRPKIAEVQQSISTVEKSMKGPPRSMQEHSAHTAASESSSHRASLHLRMEHMAKLELLLFPPEI